jgi:hypothetical protein
LLSLGTRWQTFDSDISTSPPGGTETEGAREFSGLLSGRLWPRTRDKLPTMLLLKAICFSSDLLVPSLGKDAFWLGLQAAPASCPVRGKRFTEYWNCS